MKNCYISLYLYKAPVGRVYFTGEHTSEHYNGYVHGAYLAGKFHFMLQVVGDVLSAEILILDVVFLFPGIDSADILIKCSNEKMCKYHVQGKYD